MPRRRSEELRDVLVAEQETGRGEGHSIAHPPQPPVDQASFHPFDSLLTTESYDVVIVYARRLAELEEDRLAPHFPFSQHLGEHRLALAGDVLMNEIGRASCRERV